MRWREKISKVGWLIVVSCIVLGGGLACAQSPDTFKPGSEEVFWMVLEEYKVGAGYINSGGVNLCFYGFQGIDYYAREGRRAKNKGHTDIQLY